jgi:hypothetical protein
MRRTFSFILTLRPFRPFRPFQPFQPLQPLPPFLPLLPALLIFFSATPALAQAPDAIGVRAQGMSGAFTAVADDSTASWWNPAGVASGALLNMIVEYGKPKEPPAFDSRPHRGFSIAFPALGVSYYRMGISDIQPVTSTAASADGRQDPGTPSVRTVELSQFGVTVGQSISNHFVVASTLKLSRAEGETEGGLDIGTMAIYGRLRAGLMVRNARESTLGEGDAAIELKRQFRAGVAFSSAAGTAYGGATVAFDADLRTLPTPAGDERRVAGGAEVWTRQRWIGARGGISASTVGERRTAYSGGLSVAFKRGFFVDGQLTGGSDELRKGWSAALRVTF